MVIDKKKPDNSVPIERKKIEHFDLNRIDASFPMRQYRDGQKEAIEFVLESFNDGKRIVILECPTGSGKSAIGMTVADMVPRSYYLTITKILQDQLVRDFGKQIIELKGRNAYPCTFYQREGEKMVVRKLWSRQQLEETTAKYHDCATGFCRTRWNSGKSYYCPLCFPIDGPFGDGRAKGDLRHLPVGMRHSACPYYEQVYSAMRARKVVMNFSSFLFQTTMTKRFDVPRDLLILDECFHPHTRIQTEAGLIPIGELVNDRMDVRVVSYNFQTKEIEYKSIVRWLKRGKQLTYKVLVGNRVLYPTSDHKIFTPNGKKKFGELKVGDHVYALHGQQSIENQICREVSAQPIIFIEPYEETITYDLEIADNHNYFAGNTLVSNCHNVEPQLLDFVSFSINDSHLQKRGIFIPELASPYAYYMWFQEAKVPKLIGEAIDEAKKNDDPRLMDELARLAKKYQLFVNRIESGGDTKSEWVSEYEEKLNKAGDVTYRSVTIKPVFIHGFAEELLFQYADRILMMSATILDVNVVCSSLGIRKSEVAAKRIKNRFPKENRPIYLRTVAKMTGGKQAMYKWAPALVSEVDAIMQSHAGEKGIIHTHNFAIMEYLLRHCAQDVKCRFLNQNNFLNKTKMLAEHGGRNDSVIVAPAMHEGIDLVDSLSRFQIICKVPFANFFDNKQLARRVEIDRKYYLWLTALKLIQAYGRSVRSETDHAVTYILDESIYRFIDDTRSMLPGWFLEAIQEWKTHA